MSNDIHNGIRRQEFKDKCRQEDETFKWFVNNPKIFEKEFEILDPYILSGFADSLTECQRTVKERVKLLEKCGSLSIHSSCGSAKTLSGIYFIYYYGVKTLIISSRNAIKEQWENTIKQLYDNILSIETRTTKSSNPDIYIYSPQYLIKNINQFPLDVNMIIYDEVHSLISEGFKTVIFEPEKQVRRGLRTELPYMIALSATYPTDLKSIYIIKYYFGTPMKIESSIRNTPIYIYDHHPHNYNLTHFTGNELVSIDRRYETMNDECFIDKLLDNTLNIPSNILNYMRETLNSSKYKTFIITSNIKSSVYAALRFSKEYNCKVILIRSSTEKSYLIDVSNSEINELFNDEHFVDFNISKLLAKVNAVKIDDYNMVLNESPIIVGCYHRLKEGISINQATFLICTLFIYSVIARTQILGRIRRTCNDIDIQQRIRYAIVNSGKIPTNEMELIIKREKYGRLQDNTIEFKYDFKEECKTFEYENYIYI